MGLQELRGFLSIENIENGNSVQDGDSGRRQGIRKIKIITRLFENKHFVILKYGTNVIDAKEVFNRLNSRYVLGETWFVSIDEDVYSLSFRLFNWINYRNMLFEDGVNRAFKDECLKNKYGSVIIPTIPEKVVLHFKTPCSLKTNAMNQTLKSNLCRLLFNKDKI